MGFFDRLGNLGKGATIVAGKKAGAAASEVRDAVSNLLSDEPATEDTSDIDEQRAALRAEEARLRAEAAALRAKARPAPRVEEPSPAEETPVAGTGRPLKKTL